MASAESVPKVEDVAWDHRDGYSLISRRYAVPRWIEAHVDIGDLDVELGIEVDAHGTARCRELRVQTYTARARELGTGTLGEDESTISGELLRTIPVARLVREAVTAAMNKVRELPDGRVVPLITDQGDRDEFYASFAGGMRQPRRGSPLSDDHLRRVADLYRAALERGDPPTQTIADEFPVPLARSTAAKWVMKARERGFLGPAMQGKAGEA